MNISTSMNADFFRFDYAGMSGAKSSSKNNVFTKIESFSFNVSRIDFSFQNSAQNISKDFLPAGKLSDFIDYNAIGYEGKPIESLTQSEAKSLVAENGFFGVAKTAERLSNFVIAGGGDDLEKLQEGRKGIIQGFKEAEKIWGGRLFDISYETLDKALEAIDARISALGGNILDDLA
ncbi:MAG: hydrogenase-4 component G [Campylobacteraceae bacterium]|nr:hydrogenase-4 component G [Campylobacteraceae bacterium]